MKRLLTKVALLFLILFYSVFPNSISHIVRAEELVDSGDIQVKVKTAENLSLESGKNFFESDAKEEEGHKQSRTVKRAVRATESGDTASANTLLQAPVSRTIHFHVVTRNATLYDNTLEVLACPKYPGNEVKTVNIYCAVMASGVASDWTWLGSLAFMNSIGGVENDPFTGTYWLWFSNSELGNTAMNEYEIADGDDVLITLGVWPMKLTVDKRDPALGSTVLATLMEFGFDSHWDPMWSPAEHSTFLVDGDAVFSSDGTEEITVNNKSDFSIIGTKDGFVSTKAVTIHPVFTAVKKSSSHRSSSKLIPIVNAPSPVVPVQPAIQVDIPKTPVVEIHKALHVVQSDTLVSRNIVIPVKEKSVVSADQVAMAASPFSLPEAMKWPVVLIFGLAALGFTGYIAKSRFVYE